MKLYLFADSDRPDDFFSARALRDQLDRRGHIVRFVDRMSTELADLDLVIRYGVVEPVVLVVVGKSGVRARLTRLVSAEAVEQVLQRLQSA